MTYKQAILRRSNTDRSAFRYRHWCLQLALCGTLILGACTPVEITGSIVGATIYGARAPTHEIEQIYYLGTFDPQGQLPPAMYRLRVHGQASFISGTKFASGWVPSKFIDSLTTEAKFSDGSGRPVLERDKAAEEELAKLSPGGRQFMQFGPEGIRKVPEDHRLVIMMGSSPQAFFQAIDSAVGEFSEFQRAQGSAAVKALLFEAQIQLRADRRRLEDLSAEIDAELARLSAKPSGN